MKKEYKALTLVRSALHGAFTHQDGVNARLQQAEAKVAELPPEYRRAGRALVEMCDAQEIELAAQREILIQVFTKPEAPQ